MYNESAEMTTLSGPPVGAGLLHASVGPARRPVPFEGGSRGVCSSWLLGVLDEIDYGLVLLDAQRRVLHANRTAHLELQGGRGLLVSSGVLTARRPGDAQALASAVRAAASRGLRRLLVLGQPQERMAAAVVPMGGPSTQADDDDRGVLLVLSRLQLCEGLSVDGYARSLGLTGAEARVLLQLCRGEQAADIATSQGVALSTVRTHIMSIRHKTDAASIGDLMLQMARLPPMPSALRTLGVPADGWAA